MWNALHPIILPAVLLNYVPDSLKNTYLGLLTFSGLLIAMMVQPVAGAISDGWRSAWGRRRPLMLVGTLMDFLFLAVMAWAGGLTWLVIGYFCLQLSSNTAHAPLQGLLRDRVPPEQMGAASSIKIFMDMFSLVIAALLAGRLMDSTRDPTRILIVVMSLLAVCAAVTMLGAREAPTAGDATGRTNSRDEYFSQFRIDFRHHASYWLVVAERALFLLGVYGMQSFAQYYLQDVLKMPDPPRQTGDLLAALTLALLVLVLVGGRLVDRFGSKRVLYVGSLLAATGMALMTLTRDMTGLLMCGALFGAGIGLFLTGNWALANKLAPRDEAGKYLGFANLATAGAGALARLEGPPLDWLNGLWPGQWVGYTALFVFGTLCILLSALLLARVKEPT